MTILNILGYILISIPIIGAFYVGYRIIGNLKDFLYATAMILFVVACASIGAYLIVQ